MRRLPAALTSLAVALFAACGTSGEAGKATAPAATSAGAEAPAPAAGAITVYSGRSEKLVKPILDQFTAETGIAVNLRAGDSGELAAQLMTEGKASPADLFFSQDAGALAAVEDAGLLAELPADITTAVDAAYRSPASKWVGTSGRLRVLVVNPTLAPDAPTSIDGLLDPKWAGKIGFAPTNASWQSFVTGLRVLRGEDAARDWLTAFAAQSPKPFEKNAAVRDAVNAGEIAIGLVNHYYLYEKIAAEGADKVVARNVYLTAGDPGGLLNVAGVGMLASSARSTETLALVRYLLGPEGQNYFAGKTFEYPLAAGVAQYSELPSIEQLQPPAVDLGSLKSIGETQTLLRDVELLTV